MDSQRLKNAADHADIIYRQNEVRAREQAVLAREQKLSRREKRKATASDHMMDQYQELAGAGVDSLTHATVSDWGTCPLPGCGRSFRETTSSETIGAHLRWHANNLADNGRITEIQDMGICPIPGCGFRLGTRSRKSIRDHFQTHTGLVPQTGSFQNTSTAMVFDGSAYHSTSLNAALAEFKRRLPDFREAHASLQKLAETAANAVTQIQRVKTQAQPRPRRTREQRETEEQERDAIFEASNLLG